jgi:uncharacterized protein (DUF1684 family)
MNPLRFGWVLLGVILAGAAAAGDDYVKSIEAWRAGRVARLTASDNWLALIGRHPLPPGEHTVGSAAGNAIVLAAGPGSLGTVRHDPDGRVTLTLAEGVEARIDGRTVRSAELVYRGSQPTRVTFGTVNFYVLQRGDQLFLRVRDLESPRRQHFAGIEYFPINPAWRIEACWVPFEGKHEIPITNVLGQISPALVPGKAVFTHEGRTVELLPIDEGPGEPLFFVIGDQTSGVETYGGARFLYADAPKDGKVILDFNQAQNPPCAFTPFATCPLPPKENRLPFRVTAGEKNYRGEPH